jgi:hypothetical protein
LTEFRLSFFSQLETVNLDSCLDAIFALGQITTLTLYWDDLSIDMIKIALRKQGGKKLWEVVDLAEFDLEMNDTDLLEICMLFSSKTQRMDRFGP